MIKRLVVIFLLCAVLFGVGAYLQGVPVKKKFLQPAENYNHRETLKAIDDAWDNIDLGDSYEKSAQYELAANAYKNAYFLDKGSRAVSGLKLVMTYEKLNNYNDGIQLLEQMIKNGELSSNGIKNANTIKSRLLAAKARATQGAQPQLTR